jgi:hypothetical protein
MGIVKLAFAMPAMTRVAIPLDVLLMIDGLPQLRCCYQSQTGIALKLAPKCPGADIGTWIFRSTIIS